MEWHRNVRYSSNKNLLVTRVFLMTHDAYCAIIGIAIKCYTDQQNNRDFVYISSIFRKHINMFRLRNMHSLKNHVNVLMYLLLPFSIFVCRNGLIYVHWYPSCLSPVKVVSNRPWSRFSQQKKFCVMILPLYRSFSSLQIWFNIFPILSFKTDSYLYTLTWF